jgi:alginate O-acetyltransferase complex protein AlgI
MVFSTTIFVFAYLPLFLLVYYLLPFRFRSGWILIASLVFYGWWRVDFLGLIVATTFWTYLLGRIIERNRGGSKSQAEPGRGARAALVFGVLLNLGTLAYFKYFNFGVESLNRLLEAMGGNGVTAWRVILPIGISFYVFQATSYLVDLYRGDAEPARSYLDLAAYVALFPQLVAGPIVRYKDLAGQLHKREHSFRRFSEGAVRFMGGFAKKVLIADSVARLANAAFELPYPHLADAWLGVAAYAIQIYFDFSGYSDMAIGLGLMIGFRFKENFNHPYIAGSITDFWRRWHISLSKWLRHYLYIPLGGNRKGRGRTYVNLMTVMVIGGLWHGAAWTFVLWGAWHGFWLMAERFFFDRKVSAGREGRGGFSPVGHLYTLLVVLLGWVLFRAPDLSVAGEMFAGMVGSYGWGVSDAMAWQVEGTALAALLAGTVVVYTGLFVEKRTAAAATGPIAGPVAGGPPRLKGAALSVLFVFSLLKLSAESFSPFLYFQF